MVVVGVAGKTSMRGKLASVETENGGLNATFSITSVRKLTSVTTQL
jgi:hypothetical protein